MSLRDDRRAAYNRLYNERTPENHAKYVALNLACYLAGEIDVGAYKSNCDAAERLDPRKAKHDQET